MDLQLGAKRLSLGGRLDGGPNRRVVSGRMGSGFARLPADRASNPGTTAPVYAGLRRLPASPAGGHVACPTAGKRRSGRSSGLKVNALFERFTEAAIKAVMLGQQEAKSLVSSEVRTEHIFLGLVAQADPRGAGFYGADLSLDSARDAVAHVLGRRRRNDMAGTGSRSGQDIPFSRNAKKVFETASMESRRMGMKYILPEHILIALLSSGDVGARRVIDHMAVNMDRLREDAIRRMRGEHEREALTAKRRAPGGSAEQRGGSKALEEFCRDLCEDAMLQRTDPVIGRSAEVMRVIQILGRRTKNNPILLGEPGVGKTAIAEGLARAIVSGTGPDGSPLPGWLLRKRVLALDVGLLIAGAKERGELELRVSKILQEVKADGNVVLMIDEVHTLVGAGAVGRGGGGGLDISNLLKPALGRGELQCIGATTLDEHRKYVERDTALERRFQPVLIGEPSPEDTVSILEGLRDRYERHHRCLYDSDALEACASLSSRYISDRFLPDKAIDIMDEAGSRARITAYLARQAAASPGSEAAAPLDLGAWDELTQVLDAKDECAKEGLFEEAGLLHSRELDLKARLAGPAADAPIVPVVTQADIEAIVSTWTGVPVERMSEEDSHRLLTLGDVLKERVIGQDDAVEAITRAMRRARCGLKDPDRPIATLMFSGPTGVGKTELTKALAHHYYGAADAMVRLDMSEYMERHTVAKLIGAPPGYVGYGEGGKLTEAVRRRPFTVVLLDEIEKAHPDVFNVLLQVIEDGRLTDSQGRTVSFKNTLIVLTSNVGSNVIAKGGGSLGFVVDQEGSEADGQYARIRSLVTEELKAYFRPELLNRLDEVVVFRQLGAPEVRTIADLLLAETADRMKEGKQVHLQVTHALMDKLVEEGLDVAYGARPLRRAITRLVDDPLSDAVLTGRLKQGDVAVVDVHADSGQVFVTSQRELGESKVWLNPRQIVYSSVSA